MEADLARYYHTDLRDLWRADEQGRPRLTLRMIAVRLRFLPAESALGAITNDGSPLWTRTEQLLDNLRMTIEQLAGVKKPRPHPQRPRPRAPAPSPARARRLAEARARARARRRDIEAGLIT